MIDSVLFPAMTVLAPLCWSIDAMQASPALYGCLLCWHKGHRVGMKTVYPNNWAYLPAGHRLRAALRGKHLTPGPAAGRQGRRGGGPRRGETEAGEASVPARQARPGASGACTRGAGAAGPSRTAGGTAARRRAPLSSPAQASHGRVAAGQSPGGSSSGGDSSDSGSTLEPTDTEASSVADEPEPAAGGRGNTAAQRQTGPWPVDMLPARRRSVVELAAAATAPLAVGGQGLPCGPWRVAFADPVGVASPLYELVGFNPLLGINYDAMHTIGGVIKDTIINYLQGRRKRRAPMLLYDGLHGIKPVAGGRGTCILYRC